MTSFGTGLLAAVAAACVTAAPAPLQPETAVELQRTRTLNEDHAAYGRWLAALIASQQPVQDALSSLQGSMQTVMSSNDIPRAVARFRPTIERHLAVVDAADARLALLEAPDFPALGLPEDIRLPAIKRQTVQINREIRAALQSFIPLLDAVARRDMAAARAASARSMASVSLMMRSQLLMSRASQAVLPRDGSGWEMVNVQIVYFQVMVRMIETLPRPGSPRTDTGLSRALLVFADELERIARDGGGRVEAELAQTNAALAEAGRRGDASAASLLRRSVAILSRGSECFPLARDFAALLRREAAALGGRPVTPEALFAFMQQLYRIRARLEQINNAMVAAGGTG